MKRMYVYIAECSDGSYYTGVTNNLEKRVWQHNSGIDKFSYTYSRRPVTLVFTHLFSCPVQAISFEKQIKGWSRRKKQALINGEWELLPALSTNTTKKEQLKRESAMSQNNVKDLDSASTSSA